MPVKPHRPPRLNVEIPEEIQTRMNAIFTGYGERTVVLNMMVLCLVEALEAVEKAPFLQALRHGKLELTFKEKE